MYDTSIHHNIYRTIPEGNYIKDRMSLSAIDYVLCCPIKCQYYRRFVSNENAYVDIYVKCCHGNGLRIGPLMSSQQRQITSGLAGHRCGV